MKQWQETSQIVSRLAALASIGERAALATVVKIVGSAYRRPGAKLLIESSGAMLGGVSGGCLEADVREHALRSLESGPRRRHYDTSADEDALWGLGLGCNGAVDVFIQPVTEDVALAMEQVKRLLDGNEPFAISTILDGPEAGAILVRTRSATVCLHGGEQIAEAVEATATMRLSGQSSGVDRTHGVEVFTEVMHPPLRLVIIGGGDDARPVARLAAMVGFRVCVVDHRPAFATSDRFPEADLRLVGRFDDPLPALPLGPSSFVVAMTHSLVNDRGWVKRVLGCDVPYVGVLGPRARTQQILEEVTGQSTDDRVFGPVGLDIGSDGPEQVAVSIIAELLAVQAGRSPTPLRPRAGMSHVS